MLKGQAADGNVTSVVPIYLHWGSNTVECHAACYASRKPDHVMPSSRLSVPIIIQELAEPEHKLFFKAPQSIRFRAADTCQLTAHSCNLQMILRLTLYHGLTGMHLTCYVALLLWFQASHQASFGACPRAELTSKLFFKVKPFKPGGCEGNSC